MTTGDIHFPRVSIESNLIRFLFIRRASFLLTQQRRSPSNRRATDSIFPRLAGSAELVGQKNVIQVA